MSLHTYKEQGFRIIVRSMSYSVCQACWHYHAKVITWTHIGRKLSIGHCRDGDRWGEAEKKRSHSHDQGPIPALPHVVPTLPASSTFGIVARLTKLLFVMSFRPRWTGVTRGKYA